LTLSQVYTGRAGYAADYIEGCLERIRFALDPTLEQFYFAGA